MYLYEGKIILGMQPLPNEKDRSLPISIILEVAHSLASHPSLVKSRSWRSKLCQLKR